MPHWPVLFEPERTGQELAAGRVDEAEVHFAVVRLAVEPSQLRLGIEQIDVRRPAVHEHRDHRPGLGRKPRRPEPQVVGLHIERLGRRIGQEIFAVQQRSQGHAADAQRLARETPAANGSAPDRSNNVCASWVHRDFQALR